MPTRTKIEKTIGAQSSYEGQKLSHYLLVVSELRPGDIFSEVAGERGAADSGDGAGVGQEGGDASENNSTSDSISPAADGSRAALSGSGWRWRVLGTRGKSSSDLSLFHL